MIRPIRKIIRLRLNEDPIEYLAEGISSDSIDRTERLLIIDAPNRIKNRIIEMFSSPIDKKLVSASSEKTQQITTGMSAVLFTQVRPPTDQIIIERLLKGITAKFGRSNRSDIYLNTIKISIFIAYLGFAYLYERIDDSRLGIWKIALIPIMVYIFYRMKNSFGGLRVYSRFKEDTKEHINLVNHPLTDLPLQEISQLGSTLFTGRFPYKMTLEELLHNEISLPSRLKLFLKIPIKQKTFMTTGEFSSAQKTMLTIQPAIIDSYKNVLAVIAIPESSPKSGILILPEPKDMATAMAQILNASKEERESAEQLLPEKLMPISEPEKPTISKYDSTTKSYIDRNSTPQLFRDWAARETKAVAFYKKYDALREKHPEWSINAIVDTIDDQDTSFEKESSRHLKTYLTEREAREIFFAEYPKLRQENPDLHPEETAKWIARTSPKKTVGKLVLDARKLLCIGAHYSEFFKLADDLKATESLNWQQVSRKIQKGDPKRFPFHPSVYHYHLLVRNTGNGSWQSKLP